MAKLTTKQRKAIPKSSFAVPSKAPGSGSYPINDPNHARNALSRSAGKPVAGRVRAAVKKKYPNIGMSHQMVRAIANSPKGKLPPGLTKKLGK